VGKALEYYSKIDVLVNSAGPAIQMPVEQTTLSDWQQILDSSQKQQQRSTFPDFWDWVEYKRSEIVVGSGAIISAAYQFFPGLMQWAMQRTVKTHAGECRWVPQANRRSKPDQ
jgi:NAD(P)-dependent dehydrogenase (short-subunit alcohol dehydrogenase family)